MMRIKGDWDTLHFLFGTRLAEPPLFFKPESDGTVKLCWLVPNLEFEIVGDRPTVEVFQQSYPYKSIEIIDCSI